MKIYGNKRKNGGIRVEFWKCMTVGAGGFLGSVCRYLLGFLPIAEKTKFPIITLCINLIGSFVIGFITQMAEKNHTGGTYQNLFLKVGVCGGFTTFSTFALENSQLMAEKNYSMAGVYMVCSVLLCVAGCLAGRTFAARIV